MTTINDLFNLLSLYGGKIVSTGKLPEFEITQARASSRMYVNDDGLGFAWIPDMMFPETDKEMELFERWYPLEVEPPEGLFEGIMKKLNHNT